MIGMPSTWFYRRRHLLPIKLPLGFFKLMSEALMSENVSGQISIIPKPELRGFWGSSLIKPPFRVTSADVVIICPDV